MGDAIEGFRALKDRNKALRAKYGVNCPQCSVVRPKAHPTILMPQQRCKVDGYSDPRPELTDEQWRDTE
jgi:hypothetical protein